MNRRLQWVAVLVLSAAVLGAWTPDDLLKVKGVGDARVSPDGKRVAFTVSEHLAEGEKSEQRTQVWLARADGSDAFQLTRGEKSSQGPRWSPDGKWIAFTSERSGKNNVWVIRADGGEAEQLTDLKSGLGAFKWSNSGKWIAFAAPTDTSADDEKKAKEKRDWKVVDAEHKLHRLWVVPLEKNSDGKHPVRQLTKQEVHAAQPDWSPDDRKIVFAHSPTPKVDDWTKSDISEVDVAGGEVRPVANTPAAESAPLYSPDGRWIAYSASSIPPTWASNTRVHVVPASGGAPRALAETFDRQPTLIGWTADGNSLIVSEARGTSNALYRLSLDGGSATVYSPGESVFSGASLNESRDAIGFVAQTSAAPPEAYLFPLKSAAPVQVSRVNAGLPKLPLGRTRALRWKGPGGLDVEGLLTYPVSYQEGHRYPLLLVIHGGPTGVFGQSFIGNPGLYPIATFATRGYAVLRCNIRGSSGYGKDFRFANYGDWGGKDYQDLLAGVDHVIGMGVADPERLGVMGWSYGGFMTSWVITQTRRFKAASVGAAVTNLVSFTGTADIAGFLPDYFGGESWDRMDVFLKHSPMTHVRNVATPALIQHGASDDRVPLSQGQEFHNALARRGVPTRMVIYPRTPHGPRESKFLRHIMQDNVEWFDKHLK